MLFSSLFSFSIQIFTKNTMATMNKITCHTFTTVFPIFLYLPPCSKNFVFFFFLKYLQASK